MGEFGNRGVRGKGGGKGKFGYRINLDYFRGFENYKFLDF
jgi:hypothetical protein